MKLAVYNQYCQDIYASENDFTCPSALLISFSSLMISDIEGRFSGSSFLHCSPISMHFKTCWQLNVVSSVLFHLYLHLLSTCSFHKGVILNDANKFDEKLKRYIHAELKHIKKWLIIFMQLMEDVVHFSLPSDYSAKILQVLSTLFHIYVMSSTIAHCFLKRSLWVGFGNGNPPHLLGDWMDMAIFSQQ